MLSNECKYSDITGKIIAVALEVHKTLKNGFVESVYQRSMVIEFRNTTLKVQSEFELPIYYKNQKVGARRVDFFVQNVIPVEIKATPQLEDVHLAQALNYLEVFISK
jgi:GxxExxY protein